MKCVLTHEEARQMLKLFQKPMFTNCKVYGFEAEVDPKWIEEILPPHLEPTKPYVNLEFYKSDQFVSFVSSVQCRYNDMLGEYGLAFFFDTDVAVTFGRESLAEPKKLALITVEEDGRHFVGTVSRYGQELVRIEADFGDEIGGDGIGGGYENFFHYKYSIKADGSGLEPVHLINCMFENMPKSPVQAMHASKVQLNDSPMDVIGSVPVKAINRGTYVVADKLGSASYLTAVDEEAFLPYAFMKHDYYLAIMQVVE